MILIVMMIGIVPVITMVKPISLNDPNLRRHERSNREGFEEHWPRELTSEAGRV
ncbi:hypothetical protein ACDP63_09110 [Paracoccus sp. P2]|uniref:hypothetical protein n=1 Tax=Paracoccus sp. P2 TaxID=3248840 RepID=UPI00391F6A71